MSIPAGLNLWASGHVLLFESNSTPGSICGLLVQPLSKGDDMTYRAIGSRLAATIVAAVIGLGAAAPMRAAAGIRTAPAVLGKAESRLDLTALFRAAETGLQKHFPGWHVMRRGDFDPAVAKFVNERCRLGEGPERCAGDFDGNGLVDVAFVVRKREYVRYVALNQTKPGDWDPHVLSGGTYRDGFQGGYKGFTTFSVRRGPGPIAFLSECGSGPGGTLNLKHPGVEICIWGKAAVLYYWAGSNYISRPTAD